MERNTVERVIKTETDTRTEFKKEWAVSSVGLCQKQKPQHPYHVMVSPRELWKERPAGTDYVKLFSSVQLAGEKRGGDAKNSNHPSRVFFL